MPFKIPRQNFMQKSWLLNLMVRPFNEIDFFFFSNKRKCLISMGEILNRSDFLQTNYRILFKMLCKKNVKSSLNFLFNQNAYSAIIISSTVNQHLQIFSRFHTHSDWFLKRYRQSIFVHVLTVLCPINFYMSTTKHFSFLL